MWEDEAWDAAHLLGIAKRDQSQQYVSRAATTTTAAADVRSAALSLV
jgi:hypothetical protein